tara:strand:- start:179 stop:487 length:309 start_codon:yes stop_codon:yes gene_type:complete
MSLVINTASRSAIQKIDFSDAKERLVQSKRTEGLSENLEIGSKGRMMEQIHSNREAAESSVLGNDLAKQSLLLAKKNILGNPDAAQIIQAQSVNNFNVSLLS